MEVWSATFGFMKFYKLQMKKSKKSNNTVKNCWELWYKSLFVLVCVCVCLCVVCGYYCVWMCKWCLVYEHMKIHIKCI